ncbi:MAG TPA: hypothetical protein VN259_02985 [Xanthomonadales bacterium]|nr:hypothetical protein [Xanthomonadales bacterium]
MSKEKMWAKRMQAFERSGLSRRAWCAQEKVPLSTLDYWRLRLRRSAAPVLVPVVVDSVPVAKQIEITLGDVQLRLPVGVDAEWLCSVLRGLR